MPHASRWSRRCVLVLCAFGAASLALSPSARAQPIPLWCLGEEPFAVNGGACTNPGCLDGEVPIGDAHAQGFEWKQTLLDWARTFGAADFDLPGPIPGIDSLQDAWFNGNYWNPNNYTACETDTGWSAAFTSTSLPGSNARLELEAMLLQSAGEAWLPDALATINAPASHFDMLQLEDTQGTCTVHVPEWQLDPELTSFAAMQYAGNPYYTDPAVNRAMMLRGLVNAALYLVIIDYLWWPEGALGTTYHEGGRFPVTPAPAWMQASDVSTYTHNVIPRPVMKYQDFHGANVVSGNATFNNFDISGWALSNFAYVYALASQHLGLADLPVNVRVRFEEAFMTFAERLAVQNQMTLFPNLAHRSVVALWLLMDVQSNPADRAHLEGLYRAASERFYDPNNGIYQPWGTFHDVTGFDTGYNNLNLLHVAKLMAVDPNPGPNLRAAGRGIFDLWAHLVFPDHLVNGSTHYVSPTAFNSRTGKGAAADELADGGRLQRFLLGGIAGLPWAWAALSKSGYTWGLSALNPWVEAACHFLFYPVGYFLTPNLHNLMSGGVPPNLLSPTPPDFAQAFSGLDARVHASPNFAFLYGDTTWFDAWDLAAQTPGAMAMPYESTQPAFWSAPATTSAAGPGAFFYGHPPTNGHDELAAVVHAGPVGPGYWPLPDGYGGGQLAALWSPAGGPFELARRRGRNNPPALDDWNEWSAFPVHAVSLERGNNIVASSSRIVSPDVVSQEFVTGAPTAAGALNYLALHADCTAAQLPWPAASPASSLLIGQLVSVYGKIPASGVGQGASPITAPVEYRREILTAKGYVAVQTSLCPLAANPLDEAYETIPLYYGDADPAHHQLPGPGSHGDYTISFEGITNGVPWAQGPWDPSMPSPTYADTKLIRVKRYGGVLEIELEKPRTVSLSRRWSMDNQGAQVVGVGWNVRIHLIAAPGSALPKTRTSYIMRVTN